MSSPDHEVYESKCTAHFECAMRERSALSHVKLGSCQVHNFVWMCNKRSLQELETWSNTYDDESSIKNHDMLESRNKLLSDEKEINKIAYRNKQNKQ